MLTRTYDGCTKLMIGRNVGHGREVPMAVRCVFEGTNDEWYALVDTGADLSIMPYALAQELGIDTGGAPDVALRTTDGKLWGVVRPYGVRLLPRDGRALEVEAKWWISEAWPYTAVIGWLGFLDSIRFGCNPGMVPEDEPEFLYALQ